jgi:hypothetical protein
MHVWGGEGEGQRERESERDLFCKINSQLWRLISVKLETQGRVDIALQVQGHLPAEHFLIVPLWAHSHYAKP